MDILIAVVLTYISIQYIFPALDLLYKYYQHFISDKVGIIQVRMEERVREFELKYPEEKPELTPAIGFHMPEPQSDFEEEDEEEDCCKLKNRMGFYK